MTEPNSVANGFTQDKMKEKNGSDVVNHDTKIENPINSVTDFRKKDIYEPPDGGLRFAKIY